MASRARLTHLTVLALLIALLVPTGALAQDAGFVPCDTGVTAPGGAAGIERVTVDADGEQVARGGLNPSLSADGRHVAFGSDSPDLHPDGQTLHRVYVKDRADGSIATPGDVPSLDVFPGTSDQSQRMPTMCGDGRYVAFVASESLGGSSRADHVVVWDTTNGTFALASSDAGGTPADGKSFSPAISADGTAVSFYSDADNLTDTDTDGTWDLFVKDLASGTIEQVNRPADGLPSPANTSHRMGSEPPASMSADGERIAFATEDVLAQADADEVRPWYLERDVYVRDREADVTTFLEPGEKAPGEVSQPGDIASISGDGTHVAFAGASGGPLVVHDLGTDAVHVYELADHNPFRSTEVIHRAPRLNGDGSLVAFYSNVDLTDDTNNNYENHLLLLHRVTMEITTLSVPDPGRVDDGWPWDPALRYTVAPALSPDGRFVAFAAGDAQQGWVPGDDNGSPDAFVVDRGADDVEAPSDDLEPGEVAILLEGLGGELDDKASKGMDKALSKLAKAQKKLAKAEQALAEGDDDKARKELAKGAKELGKTVHELVKLLEDADADVVGTIEQAIGHLVSFVRRHAADAVTAAEDGDAKEHAKAAEHLAGADAKAADGRYGDAMKDYEKALKHAAKALK